MPASRFFPRDGEKSIKKVVYCLFLLPLQSQTGRDLMSFVVCGVFLDVAQLVAHLVRDQEVAGSSPVIQTKGGYDANESYPPQVKR